MGINKLVFTALVIGCLTAAGLGGYLAVRQSTPAAAASVPPAAPVSESEGVILPEPAPAATPPALPAPRADADLPRQAAPEPRAVARREAPAAPRPAPARTPAPQAPARANAPVEAAPAPSVASNSGSMWETRAPVYAERPPDVPVEPPPPPAPEYVDLTVPSDAVLGIQIERTVTSELARVEDKVSARVTRDVRVGNRVAIPAGSIVGGSVTEVDRGGKMKGKARLAVRFHTITLADGTQVPIRTDAVIREGESPGGETAAKVGGAAIGGAILGAILGGGKGAAIGAGVGAGAGTAAAMTNDRNPATLPAGTSVTVRVQQPVTVTVTKE